MLNVIWLGILIISVITGVFNGTLDAVVESITSSAIAAFNICLNLIGIMSLWLGIMSIAQESGLIKLFALLLRPIMRRLFPEIPQDDPAMGAMLMNMAANFFGLTNAATPFGLQAMKELQRLNTHVHTATNAMCTFLAINTSSIQLIPMTAIAMLAANGNNHPSEIIISSLIATTISTLVAVIVVLNLAKLKCFRIKEENYDTCKPNS